MSQAVVPGDPAPVLRQGRAGHHDDGQGNGVTDKFGRLCLAPAAALGITAIAAYIGAGGLGRFIARGISQSDPIQLITGAMAVSVLAIGADLVFVVIQYGLTSKGLRVGSTR